MKGSRKERCLDRAGAPGVPALQKQSTFRRQTPPNQREPQHRGVFSVAHVLAERARRRDLPAAILAAQVILLDTRSPPSSLDASVYE